jgi:hypothetical protein
MRKNKKSCSVPVRKNKTVSNKKSEKYPIEVEAEKLIRELRLTLRKTVNWFFFYKPLNKMDSINHIIQVLALLIVIRAIVLGR